jgi:hypothetical protein
MLQLTILTYYLNLMISKKKSSKLSDFWPFFFKKNLCISDIDFVFVTRLQNFTKRVNMLFRLQQILILKFLL